jgi:cbb3-type cytochrome oxidase subunit 3
MTYDAVATISQVASLLMFIAMFIAVLAYALRPSNGTRFEHAQRVALELPVWNGSFSTRELLLY